MTAPSRTKGRTNPGYQLNDESTNLVAPLPPATEAADETPTPAKPLRLSEEIAGLIEAFAERSVALREVMDVLRGRA